MVAMEIRTERGFPQPRGRSDAWGIFETRNFLPERTRIVG